MNQNTILLSSLMLLIMLAGPAAAQHPGGAPPDQGAASAAEASAEEPGLAVSPVDLSAPLSRVERLRQLVQFLTSDESGGRRVGTTGRDVARDYLAEQLTAIGVSELNPGRGYNQGFAVTQGIQVAGEPVVELNHEALNLGSDYQVAAFSGSGTAFTTPLVFAGYGIIAPELEWSDYAGLDVKGATVVVMRGEPQEDNPESKFAGTQPSVYADMRRKASEARDLGAAAMLIINNPLTDEEDLLPELRDTYTMANFDIPVLFVRRELLINSMIGATGLSWHEWAETIDLELAPQSSVLHGAECTIDLEVEKDLATGYNVVGVIPGADPVLKDEYIVIGAHYDHLGDGGEGSLTPSETGSVHHGADDNASGTALVMELARWASEHRTELGRSVLVCLYDGEEEGLLGSTALTNNPPIELEDVFAVINADMVGRLRDDDLTIAGAGSAVEFTELLDEIGAQYQLNLLSDQTGLAGSDHLSFIRNEIPAIHLFTGSHGEYHTPRDTWDTLNYAGMERIAGFSCELLFELANRTSELEFVKPEGMTTGTKNRGNLKVTMGTIPHYAGGEEVVGMGIGDVVPGGPAEAAGMQGGDIIVKIGDSNIANVYDFIFVLQECSPGQIVPVVVIRDGESVTFQVTLAARGVAR